MIYLKVHKSYRDVVAISDKELIGKQFEENNLQLDIKESFYKGEELSEEETLNKIKYFALEDSTFNIIGPLSINISLKAGIISEDGIKRIENIPYALVLL